MMHVVMEVQHIQWLNDSDPIIVTEDFMCCLPHHRPTYFPSNTLHTSL